MKMFAIAPGLVVLATFAVEAVAVALDVNTIVLAVIGLLGTSVTGFMAMRVATLSAAQNEAKVANDKTSETVKEIHVAVNSKETATAKKIEDLTATVLQLSKTIEKLEENKRGTDLAKAVADAQVPAVVVQAPPAQV